MKKLCKISIIFLLMISFSISIVLADEAENTIENTVVQDVSVLQAKDDGGIEATAVVIIAGEETVVDNAGMKDTVQEVTVKMKVR